MVGNYGARTRSDLPAVVDLAARGLLRYRDVVSRAYGLADVAQAYEGLEQGRINGRAVISMAT